MTIARFDLRRTPSAFDPRHSTPAARTNRGRDRQLHSFMNVVGYFLIVDFLFVQSYSFIPKWRRHLMPLKVRWSKLEDGVPR